MSGVLFSVLGSMNRLCRLRSLLCFSVSLLSLNSSMYGNTKERVSAFTLAREWNLLTDDPTIIHSRFVNSFLEVEALYSLSRKRLLTTLGRQNFAISSVGGIARWSAIEDLADTEQQLKTQKKMDFCGQKKASQTESELELVNMDFPERTDLSDISRAVSLWTGNAMLYKSGQYPHKVAIYARKKVSKQKACAAFFAAMNQVGFGLFKKSGLWVVRPTESKWAWPKVTTLEKGPGKIVFDYPSPTTLGKVVKDYNKKRKKKLKLKAKPKGKFTLIAPNELTARQVDFHFLAILQLFDLKVVQGRIIAKS